MLDANTAQLVEKLRAAIRKHEDGIRAHKLSINTILEMEGEPAAYGPADFGENSQSFGTIRPDTFYGQALNTSIRKILEMRKAGGSGPASVREIYDSLVAGGFQFETKNPENAIRSLRISLSKSTAAFHRLPNGSYGLVEWYPDVKPSKAPKVESEETDESDAKTEK